MSTITALPTVGDKNNVKERLLSAIEKEYDEVFIIGSKNGALQTTWSGYRNIEEKLGLLELLKYEMIDGARGDV